MGLDMYFVEVWNYCGHCHQHKEQDLFYFRKHADLNGWLYNEWGKDKDTYNYEVREDDKGVYKYLYVGNTKDAEFDCCYMLITPELVEKLKEYVEKGEYKKYEGFFWGSSTEEDWRQTKEELIPKIEEAHKKGHQVFYHPWW